MSVFQCQLDCGRVHTDTEFKNIKKGCSDCVDKCNDMEEQTRLQELKRQVQKVDKVLKFALDRCSSSNNRSNYSNDDGTATSVARALRISSNYHLKIMTAELRKSDKNWHNTN